MSVPGLVRTFKSSSGRNSLLLACRLTARVKLNCCYAAVQQPETTDLACFSVFSVNVRHVLTKTHTVSPVIVYYGFTHVPP